MSETPIVCDETTCVSCGTAPPEDTGIKLFEMRKPEPSSHPDPRMHWTLEDMKIKRPPKLERRV